MVAVTTCGAGPAGRSTRSSVLPRCSNVSPFTSGTLLTGVTVIVLVTAALSSLPSLTIHSMVRAAGDGVIDGLKKVTLSSTVTYCALVADPPSTSRALPGSNTAGDPELRREGEGIGAVLVVGREPHASPTRCCRRPRR